MKRMSKIIITCIVFLNITTAVFATDILPENKFGIKKVAILGAGVFLVVQILFIAYQKDKLQENMLIIEKEKKQEIYKNEERKVEKNNEKIDPIVSVIKTYEWEKIENNEELAKIKKEEQDLFIPIDTESKIETLPDKMSPKKKNVVLKKDIVLEEKKINTVKRAPRGSVKIVRERKNRNLPKIEEKNNIINHMQKKNQKQEDSYKEQKNAIQLANEVKEKMKNEVIETKKRNKIVGKETKKRTKKEVNFQKEKNKNVNKK